MGCTTMLGVLPFCFKIMGVIAIHFSQSCSKRSPDTDKTSEGMGIWHLAQGIWFLYPDIKLCHQKIVPLNSMGFNLEQVLIGNAIRIAQDKCTENWLMFILDRRRESFDSRQLFSLFYFIITVITLLLLNKSTF